MKALYRCHRCGYRYPPTKLVVGPGMAYPVCADRAACDARIAVREADRKAAGR